jgi:hypothetical protein
MRYVPALPILLLLTPIALTGQDNTATANNAGRTYKVPLQIQKAEGDGDNLKLSADMMPNLFRQTVAPSPDSCPVSLRARRQGSVRMHYAGEQQERTPAQRLDVTFHNSQERNVTSMGLVVHGYDGSLQMMPADGARRNSHSLSKRIDLNISVIGGRNSNTELTMRQFGTVSRIDVESIEFADGTSWKSSEPGACSFAPDLYMLVSSR